ncbi:MAG: hypothetical protein IKP00_05975 [Victivallales bacterium]|nr:hypothetical protein [Victivallales bacterium]
MQRTHINKPFTLVELMVVISIMIIILSLSAPAFRKLAMGSSVDVAARMVSSQLMLARAEAISRRECIAVVMPDNNFNKDADDVSIYPYTAFRSAIVEEDGGSYKFKEWVPNTSWSFLPTGAVIYEVRNSCPNVLTFNSGSYSFDTSTAYTRGASETLSDGSGEMVHDKNNTSVPCIIFKKTGKTVGQGFVTISEGIYTGGTEPEKVNLPNSHFLEVNQYTGQTKFLKPKFD